MIGDPSGKTEMRKMLTEKQLEDNVGKIKPQMECFLDFSGDSELINNSEWLRNLNYICLLYTSPSPRDGLLSRMPSSA